MSRITRIIKAFKNNPKKSVVFAGFSLFGANYLQEKYQEEQLLRAYCTEAQWYGDQSHPVTQDHRHITVILNPAAAKGKCRAKFDKYCAPLLHLAGLKVAIVRTEHEGQAKELMAIMDKTDGVVVAGGDGTLSEVLTGLLRREDSWDAVSRLPLSVLPLGASSHSGRAIHGIAQDPTPKDLLEATMAIVRHMTRPVNVIEVVQEKNPHQEDDTPDQSVSPKPVYIASHFDWGAYRDAWERQDKYWYYGFLRKYVTYLFSSYKDLTWDCSSEVQYSLPCTGCSTCRPPLPQGEAPPPKRWWQYLVPDIRPTKHQQPTKLVDYSGIHNPECRAPHSLSVKDVCDIRVSSANCPATSHLPANELVFRTGIPNTSSTGFISEGWRRVYSGGADATNHEEKRVQSVTIRPTAPTKDKEGNDRQFYLDGENYEVRPLTLKVLPRPIFVFAQPDAS